MASSGDREVIRGDSTDFDELPKLYKLFGATDFDTFKANVLAWRADALQRGAIEDDDPEPIFRQANSRTLFGHDYEKQDWQIDLTLSDGRTESIIVRAKSPAQAVSKIKRANVNDRGRRKRWNNNVDTATATPLNSPEDVQELDVYQFDRKVDRGRRSLQMRNHIFPHRHDPYEERDEGRYLSRKEQDLLFDSVTEAPIPTQENVYGNTEPGTKTTPDRLAAPDRVAFAPSSDITTSFKRIANEARGYRADEQGTIERDDAGGFLSPATADQPAEPADSDA
jgi:hypothetical protein